MAVWRRAPRPGPLASLVAMGFDADKAAAALASANGDVANAVGLLTRGKAAANGANAAPAPPPAPQPQPPQPNLEA